MLRPQTFAVALAALTLAAAQKSNFTIDPTEVTAGTRASWCQGEINTCRTLCANQLKANDCNPTDLTFHCTCQNGSAPGLQYYSQSMPSFVCEQAFEDCISENASDKKAQDACITDIKDNCGTLDPNKADTGSSGDSGASTSASGTAAETGSPTGTGTSPSSTTTKNAAVANAALLGNGAAVVAAGLFAAFL